MTKPRRTQLLVQDPANPRTAQKPSAGLANELDFSELMLGMQFLNDANQVFPGLPDLLEQRFALNIQQITAPMAASAATPNSATYRIELAVAAGRAADSKIAKEFIKLQQDDPKTFAAKKWVRFMNLWFGSFENGLKAADGALDWYAAKPWKFNEQEISVKNMRDASGAQVLYYEFSGNLAQHVASFIGHIHAVSNAEMAARKAKIEAAQEAAEKLAEKSSGALQPQKPGANTPPAATPDTPAP